MNKTISIRIKADKNGKRIAHYWGQARRWLPISIDKADLALATGVLFGCVAKASRTTSDPLPIGFIHTSVDGDIFDRR